jgi:glycine C-acetyltransferase
MSGALEQFAEARLGDLEKRGLRRRIRVFEGPAASSVSVGGRRRIQLSSNNYLGLTTHPRVRAAAAEAIAAFGTGAGAVMPIAGTMTVHEECEAALAKLKGAEAAILMPSGYTANAGTVAALLGPGDLVISDALNHASIIDGIRLSGAEKRIYPHADMAALAGFLRESKAYAKCLVVTDGVFSMDGDVAPLPEIVALTEAYGAILMVDDAHATGVLGARGAGSVEHFGLHGRVEIQIGTLSKAMGAVGGFVAARRPIVDLLRQTSRPFLFSAALPPSVAATVKAAVEVMGDEPRHLERLRRNTKLFKDGLTRLGFDTGASETPITPVIIGSSKAAAQMSARLEEEGVIATEIVFPMVAEAQARIRTIVTAAHSEDELTEALAVFARVGRQLGLIE